MPSLPYQKPFCYHQFVWIYSIMFFPFIVFLEVSKGQQISKQNCQVLFSPKKQTNSEFVFLSLWLVNMCLKPEIKIQVSSMSFQVIRIEKQIRLFVFWENLAFEIKWPLAHSASPLQKSMERNKGIMNETWNQKPWKCFHQSDDNKRYKILPDSTCAEREPQIV